MINYKEYHNKFLDSVGGKDNIKSLDYCNTRLHFNEKMYL
ncbi:MAG: PTS transporter subunit EIIB [Erysipelotrichaceae bacterium]|nr:PTS transporter subunit EIIB [Erysipelotrichaceae bacterium]